MHRAGPVLAIGDGTLANVVTKELIRAVDGGCEFRIIEAALLRKDQGDKTGQTGSVHRAIR